MIQTPAAGRGAVWLGGVLVLLFSLTPLVAWLGPLGFAPLAAVCAGGSDQVSTGSTNATRPVQPYRHTGSFQAGGLGIPYEL